LGAPNEKGNDMRLRVLDFGYLSALRSQAVYHGIAAAMQSDDDPALSLVNPETPYVCVGIHQEIDREIDEAFCKAQGLPVIRRHVGGGAVYLDRNQMFTHFVYPRGKAPEFAVNLYPMFIEPVVRTYRDLGVQAEYRPVNDIQVAGRKIGGTGAASIGEATLLVGSFMFDFDTAAMARCLKVPSEKFRDKLKATLDDYMTTMARELDKLPSRDEVKRLFLKHCEDTLGVTAVEDQPTAAELKAIEAEEKALLDPDWTYRQGRKLVELGVKISAGTHLTESMHKARGGLIRAHLLGRDGHVEELMLSGDFTCLPPDGVDKLAAKLRGTPLEREALTRAVAAGLDELKLEMPAVEPADIATVIMAAAEDSD
jgi:lipoate-protein ligase A